jgi:integrase
MDTKLIVMNTDNAIKEASKVFDLLDITKNTRDDYNYRIGEFLTFIKQNGFDINSYLDFKRYLAGRTDIAVATKNKYLATAKIFLKELNRRGLLPTDITQNIKTFSQNKKHKRDGLNDTEIQTLSDKLSTLEDSPINTRLKAIITLLALQGLRQIEITRLDIKDLDLADKVAFIQGKGQDDKEPINLHPETVKALRVYLKTNKIADGALFVSRSNRGHNQRITTRTLRRLVKEVLDELGIDKSTHGFRHYFTTTMIKTYKGDINIVKGYTRHKSLEMLSVYNDSVISKEDLPRYYGAFKGVRF